MSTELNAIEVIDSSNFKSIVSGEGMIVRPIYGQPRTINTTCKLWFLSNHLPMFKFGSNAELRRLRFLHFAQKPAVKDFSLKDRVKSETSGILNWMLKGLVEILSATEIPLGSIGTQKIYDLFSITNDPVGTFVEKLCRLQVDARVSKEDLMQAYSSYLEEHGLKAENKDWFLRRLYSLFPSVQEKQIRLEGSVRARHLVGIGLLPEVETRLNEVASTREF